MIENTLSSYLGEDFQLKLMWQLLVEPEFAEKIIPHISVDYFDDTTLKKMMIIIKEYFYEYERPPNIQNKSIYQAIYKYKTPNNTIEEELLFNLLKRIELWNERVINKQIEYDGDIIREEAFTFIKQQEWRKLGEFIQEKTKTGEIRKKQFLGEIDSKILTISQIGNDDDDGVEITQNIEKALRKEFRKTIPTGIGVIDTLTGGGLGKGEIGLILSPTGVGKTTMLTKIANTAYNGEYNVCQIIFEDTIEQIQRKHYTIWSGIPLSRIDDENEEVLKRVKRFIEESKNRGHLVIKRFSQENTTILDIRNWIVRHQKKWGYKFDLIVLDYLDCLESHKRSNDRNEAELTIIKSFEAMAADFDVPAWTAIQTNRSGLDVELVEAYQTGGSIKRLQKAHFFMSIAKTVDQKTAGLANIRIIKARFAQDGQTFKDCIFNNDTLEIKIRSNIPEKVFSRMRKYDNDDIDLLEDKCNKLNTEKPSSTILLHSKISQYENSVIPTEDLKFSDSSKIQPNIKFENEKEYFDDRNNSINESLSITNKTENETNFNKSNDNVNDNIVINNNLEDEKSFIDELINENDNNCENLNNDNIKKSESDNNDFCSNQNQKLDFDDIRKIYDNS